MLKNRVLRRIVLTTLATLSLFALGACNTGNSTGHEEKLSLQITDTKAPYVSYWLKTTGKNGKTLTKKLEKFFRSTPMPATLM